MKVWASKSGKAKLNISVENGLVDLQLGFKLGFPEDPHLSPPPPDPHSSHPKYKTEVKKAKDRARAAAHQHALRTRSSESDQITQDTHQQQQGAAPVPLPQQQGAPPAVQGEDVRPSHVAAPANPLSKAAGPAAYISQKAAPAVPMNFEAVEQQAASAVFNTKSTLKPDQPAAAPAIPFQEEPSLQVVPQESSLTPVNQEAAPAFQNPEPKLVKNLPNPETVRKINHLYDKADRITMGFTCNHKIAYSGCQGEIEDNFWKIVKQNPLEFFIEDKLDENKIRETYKAEARSLGVRIY